MTVCLMLAGVAERDKAVFGEIGSHLPTTMLAVIEALTSEGDIVFPRFHQAFGLLEVGLRWVGFDRIS